jgi:hypothetical protein
MLRRLFEFFPPMSYGMPFCMPSLRELLLRLARSLVSTRKQRHDCHRDLVQLKREGQPSRLSQQEPVLRATKFEFVDSNWGRLDAYCPKFLELRAGPK